MRWMGCAVCAAALLGPGVCLGAQAPAKGTAPVMVTTGTPAVPAMLETLPYPLGAIFFWIVARGLKLSTSLPPRT